LGNQGTVSDFIASLTGPAGAQGPKGDPGIGTRVGEFVIPAYTAVEEGNTGKFNDETFGEVNWRIDARFGGSGNDHAGMRITYTFADLNVQALTAFIQEINRFSGDAGKVGLSCTLAGNVSSSSITVNCVRTDQVSPWSDNFGFLLSMLF